MAEKPVEYKKTGTGKAEDKVICGIMMPMSDKHNDYPKGHWGEVREILESAIKDAGFIPRLVGDDQAVGTIHKRIVQNLAKDEIVVCDVSSLNANVWFELGMRAAFDKAAVIVTDDHTPFQFDIQGIDHLRYPRSLRFHDIERFKEQLSARIIATYEASRKPKYSMFLKHFKDITVVGLEDEPVLLQQAVERITEQLTDISTMIKLDRTNLASPYYKYAEDEKISFNDQHIDPHRKALAIFSAYANANNQNEFMDWLVTTDLSVEKVLFAMDILSTSEPQVYKIDRLRTLFIKPASST